MGSERRELLELVSHQRTGCLLAGSPLYGDVLEAVAADVARDGPVGTLLLEVDGARFGDALLLRLLAAVHLLVLEGRAPDLAAHYPSAGGRPGPGVGAAFVDVVAAHPDAVRDGLALGVQTNEVGRSAVLVGGLLDLARGGLPLRLLEIGASAGLNLLADRYRYEGRSGVAGPAESELRFSRPWVGAEPPLGVDLRVHERRGCDRSPVDPATEAGRRRLRSYVWADQTDRVARLDAALAVVAREGAPRVDAADAAPWVADHLAVPVPGVCTVVVHSIVLQYLAEDARRAFVDAVEAAGRAATPEAPLAWLRMEPGGAQADLRLTTWPGGEARLLARSGYHGPPVAWQRGVG